MRKETSKEPLTVLKAAIVLPVTGEAIKDSCVLITDNVISDIASVDKLEQEIAGREFVIHDYGKAIIMPGLINLHTHLEHTKLSYLATESHFLDWLPGLMAATAKWSFVDRENSAKHGIGQAVSSGTSLVVDCSYNGASIKALAQSGLRAIVGLETFGVDESKADQQWQQWLENRQNLLQDACVQNALREKRLSVVAAPHSPYTVCPALWCKASQWSIENDALLLTHLAESPAEYNWFKENDNELKKFIVGAFSTRDPQFANKYEQLMHWKVLASPVEHLNNSGVLNNRLLAAHAIQVDTNDIQLLKQSHVSIAHCPRSNTMLKCGRAPIEQYLSADIRIGFGTDGAASASNLSLLSEAQFAKNLHHHYVQISNREIIELLTIKAARCLNLEEKIGSIEPGKLADLAVFRLSETTNVNKVQDPYELLMSSPVQGMALYVNGKKLDATKPGRAII